MVPRRGIEPLWCYHRRILSPLRLPVSPPRQGMESIAFVWRLVQKNDGQGSMRCEITAPTVASHASRRLDHPLHPTLFMRETKSIPMASRLLFSVAAAITGGPIGPPPRASLLRVGPLESLLNPAGWPCRLIGIGMRSPVFCVQKWNQKGLL